MTHITLERKVKTVEFLPCIARYLWHRTNSSMTRCHLTEFAIIHPVEFAKLYNHRWNFNRVRTKGQVQSNPSYTWQQIYGISSFHDFRWTFATSSHKILFFHQVSYPLFYFLSSDLLSAHRTHLHIIQCSMCQFIIFQRKISWIRYPH